MMNNKIYHNIEKLNTKVPQCSIYIYRAQWIDMIMARLSMFLMVLQNE